MSGLRGTPRVGRNLAPPDAGSQGGDYGGGAGRKLTPPTADHLTGDTSRYDRLRGNPVARDLRQASAPPGHAEGARELRAMVPDCH